MDEDGVLIRYQAGVMMRGNRVCAQVARIGRTWCVVWNLIQGKLPEICEGDSNEKS